MRREETTLLPMHVRKPYPRPLMHFRSEFVAVWGRRSALSPLIAQRSTAVAAYCAPGQPAEATSRMAIGQGPGACAAGQLQLQIFHLPHMTPSRYLHPDLTTAIYTLMVDLRIRLDPTAALADPPKRAQQRRILMRGVDFPAPPWR